MYEAHRRRDDKESSAWAILSPDVPFFRTDNGAELDEPWLLSVVTCAAPYCSRSWTAEVRRSPRGEDRARSRDCRRLGLPVARARRLGMRSFRERRRPHRPRLSRRPRGAFRGSLPRSRFRRHRLVARETVPRPLSRCVRGSPHPAVRWSPKETPDRQSRCESGGYFLTSRTLRTARVDDREARARGAALCDGADGWACREAPGDRAAASARPSRRARLVSPRSDSPDGRSAGSCRRLRGGACKVRGRW